MLMSLGPVGFDLITNIKKTGLDADATFAKHDVVGAAPVYEAMGMGETSFTLEGVLYPETLGTRGALAAIEAAQASQIPLPLMRGDFVPLGWMIIEKFSRDDEFLGPTGVGREINFTITLKRAGRPGFSMLTGLMGLFA